MQLVLLLAFVHGLTVRQIVGRFPPVYGFTFGAVAVARRFMVGVLTMFVASWDIVLKPEWCFDWLGVGALVGSVATISACGSPGSRARG